MSQILVVDDEPMLRSTFRTILERAGHQVMEAGDGAQALVMLAQNRFDLILTDIIMPNQEGIEFIAELRRKDKVVPIIAVSGGGSTGGEMFLTLATRLGATQTLFKPVRAASLLEAVNACLSGRPQTPG